MAQDRLTAFRGRVFMAKKHPFMMPDEDFQEHGQLPQFLPRFHWPKCHNMLVYTQEFRRELLSTEGMVHMLAIISYGMGQSMTLLEHPFSVAGHGNPRAGIRDIDLLYHLQDSSLHLQDWAPMDIVEPRSGLGAVMHILRVMLCNELGLDDQ
ncbi:hypothetical protein GMORB2_4670 [Geosmithia morbida]|uniref:Uncharacterized protein n=1 Tax=Geosmithia morbida TaxID=1094350 RepID=A0A9P5D163_9HYPO|nr:uncharacterized protein GMORB2_4670 [Geosmithia morbida]KAF4119540.1 hypothetical protein GMORB2_4670 [Geosmithia morbida]